jgi:hypothetical protein
VQVELVVTIDHILMRMIMFLIILLSWKAVMEVAFAHILVSVSCSMQYVVVASEVLMLQGWWQNCCTWQYYYYYPY